ASFKVTDLQIGNASRGLVTRSPTYLVTDFPSRLRSLLAIRSRSPRREASSHRLPPQAYKNITAAHDNYDLPTECGALHSNIMWLHSRSTEGHAADGSADEIARRRRHSF